MVNCQKLKKRADFQNLTHKSQAFKTPAFILLYAPQQQLESSPQNQTDSGSSEPTLRIGYTATKRSIGNAIMRNRAKRRMRALADSLIRLNDNFKLPKGVAAADMVLIARYKIEDTPFEALQADLKEQLEKAGCSV